MPTLSDLKITARNLNVKGRSKMNKKQLLAAITALKKSKKSRKPAKKKSRKPAKKKSRKPAKKKSRKPAKKKSRKPAKKKFIIMCDYTDKSIVLLGSTYAHKEEIKKAGGKYNPNLSIGKGWVFPKTKKKAVEKLVKKMRSAPAKSRKAVKKSRKKKVKKAKFKFPACAKFSCDHPLLCSSASRAIGWEGSHNVYDVRMDGKDLVANKCDGGNLVTLFPNYMPGGNYGVVSNDEGRYVSLTNPGQPGNEVKLWKTGGGSCKGCSDNDCSQLDSRYPDKPLCHASAAVDIGLGLLGTQRLSRDKEEKKIGKIISTYEGVLPVVRDWISDATVREKLGSKTWTKMIHKFNCMIGTGDNKMNILACQVWALKHLWDAYEAVKKGIKMQERMKEEGKFNSIGMEKNKETAEKAIKNFRERLQIIKRMMQIIVGPSLDDPSGNAPPYSTRVAKHYESHEAEYNTLRERLDALTGSKLTSANLMQRLKNLSSLIRARDDFRQNMWF